MKCVFCGCKDNKVVDSRYLKDTAIRRRRECINCGKRFTTYEKVETSEKLADGGTALSELGVNTGTIVMNANGSQYDVIIEEGDSIQDLINFFGLSSESEL